MSGSGERGHQDPSIHQKGMRTHSPHQHTSGRDGHGHGSSGADGKQEPRIHQKGMHHKAPSAVEPHPKGPSVDVADRPSADYVNRVNVPGPRNA